MKAPEARVNKLIPFKKTISIKRISALIDKAFVKLRPHYDTTPTGEEFNTFIEDLWSIFPNIRRDVIYASLLTLAGTQITREVLRYSVWRLAANLDKLRAGKPVVPWTRQRDLEWVACKFVFGKLGRNTKGILGFWYEYRIITGSPAGLKFSGFYSLKYIRFLAKALGFSSNKKSKYKFSDGSELVSMQCHILLDPELSSETEPRFYHFYVPSSDKVANRKLLKRRMRVTPCPLSFTLSELQCFKCWMGYDKCLAGTHPATYITKPCPRCMKPETWFETSKSVICVDCENDEVIGKAE